MATTIALLMVTIVFVNNRLWSSVAESEFNSAKQYMQTIGLQIDDVAWTTGRKETVRYSSNYGSVSIEENALSYRVDVKTSDGRRYQYSYNVSILQFKIPESRYSITNNYYERIFPQVIGNLAFSGTSAPVARVFVVEKLPMYDGSYTRVVVAPAVRVLSSVVNGSTNVYYIKLYLPWLVKGSAQGSAQSVTMTGSSIATQTKNQVTGVNLTVTFPKQLLGFDSSFFNFPSLNQSIPIPTVGYSDKILEVYAGKVETTLGVQS
jgi:hypothetical protein